MESFRQLIINIKSTTMDDGKKILENENTRVKEQAINHKETDGRNINYQEKQRREKHHPRDNA